MALTSQQFQTLDAILNTFVADVTGPDVEKLLTYAVDDAHAAAIRRFASQTAANVKLTEVIADKISKSISQESRDNMLFVLDMLNRSVGNFALTGYATPFAQLEESDRAAALLNLANSHFETKRNIFLALKSLSLSFFYMTAPEGVNPSWAAMRYVAGAPGVKAAETPAIQMVQVNENLKFDVDVVVVGSGIGGSVLAAELAQAGHTVLVLEQGPFVAPKDFTLLEQDAYKAMFVEEGLLMTTNGEVRIMAGGTLGGGTTINWSCCLRTPHYVREEWAGEHGLSHFTSQAFCDDLEKTEKRLQVRDIPVHNNANMLLVKGCKKLGFPVKFAPQNTVGEHWCGTCGMGCKTNGKQSATVTYLTDAAQAGARFIDNCTVKKVTSKKGVATGVDALVNGKHAIHVEAKLVVAAAGALNTPLLLKRSNLRNSHIGRNLRLHPVAVVLGVYPDQVNPGQGPILTVVSDVVENFEGDYYGAKLECPALHPLFFSAATPWTSKAQSKATMLQYPNSMMIIVLSRDKGSGEVAEGPDGKLKVSYRIGDKDKRSLIAGIKAAAKVHLAAGASYIYMGSQTVPGYTPTPEGLNDPGFAKWCQAVEDINIRMGDVPLFSAHQMGTAKMSTSASRGVVNPQGETWEMKNLFVADTSVFPTPSGANPMLTCYATAHHIAKAAKERMAQLKAPPSKL